MQYSFDKAFKIGFAGTVAFFVVVNIASYVLARQEYQLAAKTNKFLPIGGNFRWGFPFYWDGYNSPFFLADNFIGLVLNFSAIVGCALAVGLIAQKFSQKAPRQSA